jgi:Ni/Fe-hydrogenase subunit HybB-like protein
MAGFSKDQMIPIIKSAYHRVLSGGMVYLIFVGIFGLMMLIGIGAGIHALFISGTRHAYGTYREVPVAILISTYVFFVVASTGLCLLSSLPHLFSISDFMPIAKRSVYLSIITILAGFLVIGLEIEHPFRMVLYNIISPNLNSNIWWMGTLYSFALVFLTIEFIFLMKEEKHKKAMIVCLLGVTTEVAANTNLGGVFAMMHGRPYWYGPYLPVYFLLSAAITGCAFIIFFFGLSFWINRKTIDLQTEKALESVGKLTILLLIIIMIFTVWKMFATSVGGQSAIEAMRALLAGPYAFNFWGIEVIGGMIIPFVLLLISRAKNMMIMFVASVFMIFSIFFMRLDLVIVGQIVPLYLELGASEYSRLHTYTPSVHEILVVLGGVGFCGLAFLLGEKIFNGFQQMESGHVPEQIAVVVKEAQEAP